MISEVNSLSGLSSSSTTSRSLASGADPSASALSSNSSIQEDSVSQIVSILNAHLGSLKWIDESTNSLREKVERIRRGTASAGVRGDSGRRGYDDEEDGFNRSTNNRGYRGATPSGVSIRSSGSRYGL